MVILALLAAGSVVYLQHRFDEGDRKSALRVMNEFRVPSTKRSLPDVINARHPTANVFWQATTESSCRQVIRVSAVVSEPKPGQSEASVHVYEFLVDINTVHIAPGNELGRLAIAELDVPLGFSANAASASASASAIPSVSASASGPHL
jgi:hypothetical protein